METFCYQRNKYYLWYNPILNLLHIFSDSKHLLANKDFKKYWPFKFSHPEIEIKFKDQTSKKDLTGVIAKIFKQLKESADNHFNHPIKNVVLSIPLSTNEKQKSLLRTGAESVGLTIVEFIKDPIAILYAYVEEFGTRSGENVLVFDFGESKLDVMIAHMEKDKCDVLAEKGDPNIQ